MKKIVSLVGARPQFIKEALVGAYASTQQKWDHVVVHSGQHYDANMSDIFFSELHIPRPKYFLGVGSGTHGAMTAAVLKATEEVLLAEKPAALIVYGDTNTTLAGALAAVKLHIPVVHVEAGIRMQPATMPEEINRVVTDRLASTLCCCSELGKQNLAREGIEKGVWVTGDIMYDVFQQMEHLFVTKDVCAPYGLSHDGFIVFTLHRDYTVDCPVTLKSILQELGEVQKNMGLPVVWPVHPRVKKRIREFGYEALAQKFIVVDPLGYVELMSLIRAACFVITDSGGLQKEAYYARKRAVVLMPDSGWQELASSGWNIVSPPQEKRLCLDCMRVTEHCPYPQDVYGNGTAVIRIAEAVLDTVAATGSKI